MITAEILKPCVVCCQPGSVVEVTETQFRCLGGAARALENNAPIPHKIVDTITAETESVEKTVENVENVPEVVTEESSDIPAPEEESSEKRKKKSGKKA